MALRIKTAIFSPRVRVDIEKNKGSHTEETNRREETQSEIPQCQRSTPVPGGSLLEVGTSPENSDSIDNSACHGNPDIVLHIITGTHRVVVQFEPMARWSNESILVRRPTKISEILYTKYGYLREVSLSIGRKHT